ncbi:alpha/beta hydrolase [Natronospirillum operosum]|uniref:Alpha/beta hydrolase n=1 Tax=Natronospirillum operosum TaxID=2759953 RepID=A0A4Z0WE42_9GAMM|nr:alpha/beta hydrolase [Natronospirillum operosum]TGG92411.1 alpha/beta hydrolase [Natronospirillum operosum]
MTALNAQLEDWLERLNRLVAQQRAQGSTPTAVNAREGLANMTATLVTARPTLPRVVDALVDGGRYPVPVRIYDPAPEQDKAVCLYIHGGGHTAGGITVYDPICRKLAVASQRLVVSVEYRLAPECPYPQGLQDCVDVVRHLWPTLDDKGFWYQPELAVAGDSGGGALTATLCAELQHEEEALVQQQILIYPNLDYTLSYPSIHELASGYLLERERIRWYYDQYFQKGEDRAAASPLYMPITPGLPETLIITAGFCPLKDEAIAYRDALQKEGVRCTHRHFPTLLHAFLNMEDLVEADCAEAYRTMAAFMRRRAD